MKTRILLAAAILGALFIIGNHSQASGNLLLNNSVESGSATAIDSFSADSWGTLKASFSVLTTGAQNGSRSAYVRVTNYVSGDARWTASAIDVQPGQTYAYSNWYKSNVRTEINAEVEMLDGSRQYLWLRDVAGSRTAWKQVTTKFVAPAGAKNVRVYHLIARNGWLQTDSYSLTQGTSQTTTTTVTPTATTTVVPTPTTTTTVTPTTTITPTTTVQPTVTPPPPTATTPFSRPLVSIEFDDGWTSAYQYGLPLVESFGWRPTQYIITDTAVNNANYGNGTYMTPAQIQDWNRRGDVGSHTVSHPSLPSLSTAMMTNELTLSKNYLDGILGEPTKLFVTPYCESNTNVVNVAKTLYQSLRNCQPITNTKANFDRYNLKSFIVLNSTTDAELTAALNAAKASNGWLILVWH
jgi:peptidoglycan/xylan/chitin deacetylase (PgdA/CDA1 family)